MNAQEKRAKRVALAKEVLARLSAEELFPGFGNYCVPADKGGNSCMVCATGALLVACCGIPDKALGLWGIDEDIVVECLESVFNTKELAIIEAAFERRIDAPIAGLVEFESKDDVLTTAADMFFDGGTLSNEADEAQRRLRAIMQNIIDNDGEFRP